MLLYSVLKQWDIPIHTIKFMFLLQMIIIVILKLNSTNLAVSDCLGMLKFNTHLDKYWITSTTTIPNFLHPGGKYCKAIKHPGEYL